MEERFPESKPYNAVKGCPEGYHHRKEYTTSNGTFVPARCVKSTTIHPQTTAEYRAQLSAKRHQRLKGVRGRLGLTKKCPSGYILRAPFKRKFSSTVKNQGFNVHKKNKTYRVYPTAHSVLVKAACIKDKGLPGKGPVSGEGIGPLHKGELTAYGYNVHKTEQERQEDLKKAIEVFGALGVYRKLDAVAKLTKRTAPEASHIFTKDRQWVKANYPLKAPS
jgi:hypothetical protein